MNPSNLRVKDSEKVENDWKHSFEDAHDEMSRYLEAAALMSVGLAHKSAARDTYMRYWWQNPVFPI